MKIVSSLRTVVFMFGTLLQSWTTIRVKGDSIPNITQGADAWIDIGDHEDLVAYVDVREVSNTGGQPPKLAYETSPTRHDAGFVAMTSAFTVTAGLRVDRFFSSMCAVPPARFVRWKLFTVNGANPYDVTFRIWLGSYSLVRGWR